MSQVNVYSGMYLVALAFFLDQMCYRVSVAFVLYCRVECTKERESLIEGRREAVRDNTLVWKASGTE